MAEAEIAERRVGAVVQIGAWPETLAEAGDALEQLVGSAVPGPGRSAGPLLGLAPGRWLLVADDPGWQRRLAAAFANSQACLTDLSSARVVLRLEGKGTLDLPRRHIAFDLDPSAFPVGSCAQTQIHHVSVLLHRLDEQAFDLLVPRSFARSLREWLAH